MGKRSDQTEDEFLTAMDPEARDALLAMRDRPADEEPPTRNGSA